jgi:FKBP-type peptidyl-prolyl cis-trans isomerase
LLLFTFVTTIFAATDGSSEKNSGSETKNSGATELKTEVLYAPEVCNSKSKNGDMLTMHYKGTLQDGTAFDSRYETSLQ